MLREHFRLVTEVVAGFDGFYVGFGNIGFFLELCFQGFDRGFDRQVVKPVESTQHKHVFTAVDVFCAQTSLGKRFAGECYNRNFEHGIVLDRAIFKRVIFFTVTGKFEVFRVKTIGVGKNDAAMMQVFEVCFQCRCVHRDHDIKLCSRSIDGFAAELKLETGDACNGSGGCADFRRKVREGIDVRTVNSYRICELGTG